MGFDAIDRQFQPKPSKLVVLECANCDSTDDTVRARVPYWYNGAVAVPLCNTCGILSLPTSHYLAQQHQQALDDCYLQAYPMQPL